MKSSVRATLVLCAVTLAACGAKSDGNPSAAASDAPALKPVASIIDLMMGQVDPAADFLWESVATVSTTEGTVEHQPRTEQEWLEVRLKALQLAEAANLLMMPGRRVAHEGQRLEDEGTDGNLTQEQAQAALDQDHGAFIGFAAALREVAIQQVDAIDRRDIPRFFDLGAQLDEVCEGCHLKFWYPGAKTPPGA